MGVEVWGALDGVFSTDRSMKEKKRNRIRGGLGSGGMGTNGMDFGLWGR